MLDKKNKRPMTFHISKDSNLVSLFKKYVVGCINYKIRMDVDQYDDSDVENEIFEPYLPPKVIFDRLNKLEEFDCDNNAPDVIYRFRK